MKEKSIDKVKNEDLVRIYEMQNALLKSRKEILPSKYWIMINKRNIEQLKKFGYKNFKITLARNYFTWISAGRKFWKEDQFDFLLSKLPRHLIFINFFRSFRSFFKIGNKNLSSLKTFKYILLTYMIWEFVSRNGGENIFNKLDEPLEGNPIKLFRKKKLITQDLANSVLEYKSVMDHIKKDEINSILELGSGYGRTAYVFLKLLPNIKYIFVDIPPALFIAEKYISNQFKNEVVFKFRTFNSYNEIKGEFEKSRIAFFLPNQLDLLPPKSVNLFINISSFHEMRPDQINYYFSCIDKLIKKYIYIKQWKFTKVPYENITLTEKDYPIRKNWKKIYWRECKVQTRFFEALLHIQ